MAQNSTSHKIERNKEENEESCTHKKWPSVFGHVTQI
jgi:hypothetical protein